MKVLILGGGGREHALAWKLAQSPRVTKLYAAPGNPGIAALAENVRADHNSIAALAEFAAAEGIDLTVVGPETYLALGLADEFRRRGLKVFGPGRAAAAIEADKAFAKDFMARHGIPTAAYRVFSAPEEARAYLRAHGAPVVVKASGLAAGKGAVVCRTVHEAERAVTDLMERRIFGEAGERVVIEDFLAGEEASLLVLTDGETALPLPLAQDHKRLGEGDTGPNTGGMGACAPAGVLGATGIDRAMETIVRPTLRGMAAEGRPYRGVLYVGLMVTAEGPKVVEYNCRFGDPEAQAVLPLIRDDLAELCLAAAEGSLGGRTVAAHAGSAVCVVLASGGYPGDYRTGLPIAGLDEAAGLPGVTVFHAGTARRGGDVVTAGGRVLGVVGTGPDLAAARERAYAGASRIEFEGMYYRRDIATRGTAVDDRRRGGRDR
ncbi:MAG: phosphoribosylamine--glycine ligase [Bacteroidota bacterium]